jgi:copper(I)-binding protein
MRETGRVTGLGSRRKITTSTRSIAATLLVLGGLVSGCAGSATDDPNTAGNATNVPNSLPPGVGTSADGDITVSGLVIHRTGDHLDISAKISNTGAAADQLLSISSQVTATLTESPALAIPAKGTVSLGDGGTSTVLTINARLEPGGSVALTLNFKAAGQVDDYASFTGS